MKVCAACGQRSDGESWVCRTCGAAPRFDRGVAIFPTEVDGATDSARDADYLVTDLTAAEQWHFWFQSRRRLVLWMLERHCPSLKSALDVGCGTGFILEGLHHRQPAVRLAGCDLNARSLEVARDRLPSAFIFKAVADRLPFDAEFDAVTALDVIEHIDDDGAALGGMYRALRPGGTLVLTVPQHPSLWSAVDDFSCHRRRYTRAGLLRTVRAAGFQVARCTSCFMLTLPLLAASRLRGRQEPFDPAREFRIHRSVNALLDGIMESEWWVIKSGLALPVGGSLLLVGHRRSA